MTCAIDHIYRSSDPTLHGFCSLGCPHPQAEKPDDSHDAILESVQVPRSALVQLTDMASFAAKLADPQRRTEDRL